MSKSPDTNSTFSIAQDFAGISCELSRMKVLTKILAADHNGCSPDLTEDDRGAIADILEDRIDALAEAVNRLEMAEIDKRRDRAGLA